MPLRLCRFTLGGYYGLEFASFYANAWSCPSSSVAVSSSAVNATATNGKLTYDASNQQYGFNLKVCGCVIGPDHRTGGVCMLRSPDAHGQLGSQLPAASGCTAAAALRM